MAVTSSTTSTPTNVGLSYDQFQTIEQQISALQSSVNSVADSYSADDTTDSWTATQANDVLPTDDDSSGDSSGAEQSGAYSSWQSTLQQLAGADSPDTSAMVSAADADGIPRQTAISDIYDALGLNDAASNNPQLGDWMSMILQSGNSLDPDVLSNLLDMLETVADPSQTHGNGSQRGLQAQLAAMKSQMGQMLGQLGGMQSDMESGFSNLQSQVNTLAQQVTAWQKYDTKIQGFENQVQAAAQSNDSLSPAEVNNIVDTMASTQAPGEPANYVSAAEWNATVAGINNADISDTQATIETGQVAQQILAGASSGSLTIDPSVQGDITQAASAGAAAAAASTSTDAAASTSTAAPDPSTPAS